MTTVSPIHRDCGVVDPNSISDLTIYVTHLHHPPLLLTSRSISLLVLWAIQCWRPIHLPRVQSAYRTVQLLIYDVKNMIKYQTSLIQSVPPITGAY